MVSFTEGNRRLLELARILERIPAVHPVAEGQLRGYDQTDVIHPCGSPACAWGHWFYGNKRRFKRIAKEHSIDSEYIKSALEAWRTPDLGGYEYVPYSGGAIREFGISYMDVHAIFSGGGCDSAKTGADAAKYIRNFVALRRRESRAGRL